MKNVNTRALRAEVNAEINSNRITHNVKEATPLWERKLLKSMKQTAVHRGRRVM